MVAHQSPDRGIPSSTLAALRGILVSSLSRENLSSIDRYSTSRRRVTFHETCKCIILFHNSHWFYIRFWLYYIYIFFCRFFKSIKDYFFFINFTQSYVVSRIFFSFLILVRFWIYILLWVHSNFLRNSLYIYKL